MKLAPVLVLAVAGISCALQAQVQMHGHVGPAFPPVSAALPKVHPERPATGLGAHDFLYAGESHDRRIFIVRKGKIAWSYCSPVGVNPGADGILEALETLSKQPTK